MTAFEPGDELTLTIEPPPLSTMCGMQCLAINIMDFTFTRRHAEVPTRPGRRRRRCREAQTPTLFTSTSTPPNRAADAATASAHDQGRRRRRR